MSADTLLYIVLWCAALSGTSVSLYILLFVADRLYKTTSSHMRVLDWREFFNKHNRGVALPVGSRIADGLNRAGVAQTVATVAAYRAGARDRRRRT